MEKKGGLENEVLQADVIRRAFGGIECLPQAIVNFIAKEGVLVSENYDEGRKVEPVYETLGKSVQVALRPEHYFIARTMGMGESTKKYYSKLNESEIHPDMIKANKGVVDWLDMRDGVWEKSIRNDVYDYAVRFAGMVEPDRNVVVYGCGGGAEVAIIGRAREYFGHQGKVIAVDEVKNACQNTQNLVDGFGLDNCVVNNGDNLEVAVLVNAGVSPYRGELGGVFSAWGMAGGKSHEIVCRQTLELMRPEGGVFGSIESPGGRFDLQTYERIIRKGMMPTGVMNLVELRQLDGKKYAVGKQMFPVFQEYISRQGVLVLRSGAGDKNRFDCVLGVVGDAVKLPVELSDEKVREVLVSIRDDMKVYFRSGLKEVVRNILNN